MSASPSLQVEPSSYDGWEFESLACAVNYYRWIFSLFDARLRGRCLEIGAGTGNFTRNLIHGGSVSSLTCLEPSPRHATALASVLEDSRIPCRILNETVEAYLLDQGDPAMYDSAVTINVLEHIEDDHAAIRGLGERIVQGGFLCLMVPAHPFLYGSMDRVFGHLRRYDRERMRALAAGSGLRIVEMHHLNLIGALTWLLMGRVLRRRSWSSGSVAAYDRFVIPAIRRCEGILRPAAGQSLYAVMERL
jgi:SAM-dependent methyltransferase